MNQNPKAAALKTELDGIGDRLREERLQAGISQRELARRVGLSASLISQLESGLSKPSVGTLYAIVTELNVSVERVIRGDTPAGTAPKAKSESAPSPLVHPEDRATIDLASGVRWEKLTSERDDGVDFLHIIYDVGGSSTADSSLMRHNGREYGYVISGTLGIQVGFEEYVMSPGDSIAFDSTRPHRLYNKGNEPVHSVWFVIGRSADDRAVFE
ncbi:MAG: XRE family transcriptional regulator [Acidimicrobiia bacterium]